MDVEKIPLEEWQKKGGQPKADFNECLRLSRSLLEHNVHKPDELNSREVLAISYYYDRASDHGLIGTFCYPLFQPSICISNRLFSYRLIGRRRADNQRSV